MATMGIGLPRFIDRHAKRHHKIRDETEGRGGIGNPENLRLMMRPLEVQGTVHEEHPQRGRRKVCPKVDIVLEHSRENFADLLYGRFPRSEAKDWH